MSLQIDTPWDYHPSAGLLQHRPKTHRFPAATYLHRTVAREERAFATQLLASSGRFAGRRIGGLSMVVLGLLAALLFLVASGRSTTSTEILVLLGLGATLLVAAVRIVILLRRHDRDHDLLTDRVRAYEGRLLELRAQRQRLA
jgi:hypothetical protein